MMADSCESASRAVKPETNEAITDLVHGIIEGKRSSGQLDDSNLTLNELRTIEETFIDIFRGLFHPRIDYTKAVQEPSKREPANARQRACRRSQAPSSGVGRVSETCRAGRANP